MAVSEVTDSNFKEKVLDSKLPVLVDFFATWCGPCKIAEPVLEELSKENEGKAVIVKIDVDKNPKTTGQFNIMSIPTTIFIKGGKEEGRQIGFAGKEPFEELLKS